MGLLSVESSTKATALYDRSPNRASNLVGVKICTTGIRESDSDSASRNTVTGNVSTHNGLDAFDTHTTKQA